MNPILTTLDHSSSPSQMKTILAKDGYTGSLLVLVPGDETSGNDVEQTHDHILYVVEGQATVRSADVSTILSRDQALLIPKGKKHVIAARAAGYTKLLRIEVPPRQLITPQLITFDS